LEYEYADGTVEWFKNRAAGIEHGLTIQHAPTSHDGTLTLEVALDGMTAAVGDDGLVFRGADDEELLSYTGLKVWDADDQILDAAMQPCEGGFTFWVDTQGARFPIVVDPLVTTVDDTLKPFEGNENNGFGNSVSLSGNTLLVGAVGDDLNGTASGSAYVFVHDSSDGWIFQARLVPGDGARLDYFGSCVSLDGDTALIGASSDDDNGNASGSAYVFVRNQQGAWSEQAKLLALDGSANDLFGHSVSVDEHTAIVGAFGDDDNGAFSGSAYVFTRDEFGFWSQQAKLLATDGAPEDYFGRGAVSACGSSAVVGAGWDDENGSDSGSAYVFVRDELGVWTEQAKLVAADGEEGARFGISVSLDSDRALIGARFDDEAGNSAGSAYIFTRDELGT
jgi:hypothetical protein